MQTETPPRAAFEVKLEKKEYVAAALIGARRSGVLRSAPVVVVISLALLAVGPLTMNWFQATSTILVPVVMCLACPLLLILFFGVEPEGVRKRAAADFVAFDGLMQPASVRLYADNAVTVTPTLTLYDQYALIRECVETQELLILIKDRERQLVIPKRCLPPEKREEILEFLRLTFIRRRRVMRSWLF